MLVHVSTLAVGHFAGSPNVFDMYRLWVKLYGMNSKLIKIIIIIIIIILNFSLEQATKDHKGVDVYLYSFFNLGTRWGGWSTSRPIRFTPGKDPVPIV